MLHFNRYWMLASLLVLSFSIGGCAHTRSPAPDGPLCFPELNEENEPVFSCRYPEGNKKDFDFFEIPMICEPKDSYLKYLEWCGTCN